MTPRDSHAPAPAAPAIATVSVSLFGTNCYVLTAASGRTAVIDPGGDPAIVLEAIERAGGVLDTLLCTHGHIDHIEAAGAVKARRGGRIVLHRLDLPLWERVDAQAGLFGLPEPTALPPPDLLLEGGETLDLGGVPIEVVHVPGHSPGSVMYVVPAAGAAFNGDTVFAMGVGRTDLWGGDGAQLARSVTQRIFSMADDVVLYPGHGPTLSVQASRRMRAWLG